MTLQDESRLSFYKEIAEISTHKNVVLVQHVETRKIFVRKVLRVYDRDVYQELKEQAYLFLPPGFRTGIWWKMLLALIGYALLWAVGLSLEVNDAAGNPGTGMLLFANRAAVIGIGMIWIFFWFDYMGIHSRLPLMRKKKQKVVGYIVYTFLIAFVIMMILIIFENSL